MADERAPLRLDQNYVKAKSGLGVPNPSQELELLERVTTPTMGVADVVHLSPVSFVPRYGIRGSAGAVAAQHATVQFSAPVPFLIDDFDSENELTDIAIGSTSAVAGAPLNALFLQNPAPNLAPGTLVYTQGTVINANFRAGFRCEPNRGYHLGLIVEPGQFVTFMANNQNVAMNFFVTIQEFPGGVSAAQQ